MRLRVVHRTRYAYGEPVTTSHHEARLVAARERVPAHGLATSS